MKMRIEYRCRGGAWGVLALFLILFLIWEGVTRLNWNLTHKIGEQFDRTNGRLIDVQPGPLHASYG